MTVRRGRGRARATLELIEKMIEVAEPIQPCGVRALAYQLFNRKLIPSMGLKHTQKVSTLSVIAREEGTMPWGWIVDPTREQQGVPTWADPVEFAWTMQRAYRRNKWQDQPTHVSVWSEKATVEGTIRPVLERYEVPFQFLHGWSGATPVWDAARANLDRDQDTLILYIGDYDPSGMYMSEADLPKRLARYSSADPRVRSKKDVDLGWARRFLAENRLEIRRIALSEADTVALGEATRFPASDKKDKPDKKGDSRYAWFVRNYGDWCWELDALSPRVLRDRLEQAIAAELDWESWDRCCRGEEAEREVIIDTCRRWRSISVPRSGIVRALRGRMTAMGQETRIERCDSTRGLQSLQLAASGFHRPPRRGDPLAELGQLFHQPFEVGLGLVEVGLGVGDRPFPLFLEPGLLFLAGLARGALVADLGTARLEVVGRAALPALAFADDAFDRRHYLTFYSS
jgi:hypothetical protein